MMKKDLITIMSELPKGSFKWVSEKSGLNYRTILRIAKGENTPRVKTIVKINKAIKEIKKELL